MPSGDDLICRPIGCDQCFENDYCSVATNGDQIPGQCPANHHCLVDAGDVIATPLCILRPLTSPTFEDFVTRLLGTDDPRLPALKKTLADVRGDFTEIFRTVKIPNTIEVEDIPVIDGPLTEFSTSITDANIFFEAGRLVLRLDMSEAHIGFADGINTTTDGAWSIDFIYGIYTGPRPTDADDRDFSNPYAGLNFTLVDVRANGAISVPIWFDQSLEPLTAELTEKLGPFADQTINAILRVVGGVQEDSSGLLNAPSPLRCMFSPPNTIRALPQQCSDPGNPFQDIRWAVATNAIDIGYGTCR